MKDAAEILPAERIIRYRGHGVALFANFFRYELQRRGAGLWLDTDQYLIAPIQLDRPYIFGFEEPGMIANGVLQLPSDSPLLTELLDVFGEREVPFWLPPVERWKARSRLRSQGRTDLSKMPWGSAGPKALTALARKHGLMHWALEPDVLYPIHYKQARWILDPNLRLEDLITTRSVGFHLWNNIIAGYKEQEAPPGSFLERLHEEGQPD